MTKEVQKAIDFIHAYMHPTSDSEYEQRKRKYRDMAIQALEKETVSKESYDHEYFLRKEFEIKIARLEQQESILDKIRAEIEEKYGHCDICEYFEDYDYEDNNISEYRYVASVKDILQIIDKYKADKKDCTTCIGFGDKDYAQSFCHDCIKDIQNHYKADKE